MTVYIMIIYINIYYDVSYELIKKNVDPKQP